MKRLQIILTDKQHDFVRVLLIKAKGSFTLEGTDYKFGDTLARIFREWSNQKGFTGEGDTIENIRDLDLIINDPEELNYILGLIKMCNKGASEGSVRALSEYIKRVDPMWNVKLDRDLYPPVNKQVAEKAEDLFFDVRDEVLD